MDLFTDETEVQDIRMVQRVVDLFERRPHIQKLVRLGLGLEYDEEDASEDDYDYGRTNFNGSRARSSSSVYPPLNYYPSLFELCHPASANVRTEDSSTERKDRVVQERKKIKGKAEKKRRKKEKRKERKRLEKLEKLDKQTPKVEQSTEQPKAEESTAGYDEDGVNQQASANETGSSNGSEDDYNDEDSDKEDSLSSEELDLTCSFVSKAALRVQRKLEQKPKSERKEQKKTRTKEEMTPVQKDSSQQDAPACSRNTFEDNVKISTDLAIIGNKFASAGELNKAVKYFTDAIKYNPTEYKLFGNRSFCFERMQEYEKALVDAELGLSMYPGWVKGLFRKGRALAGLKRYEEAAQALQEVLKLESSCAEAAAELMRVQIMQLMEYGFTREQSSNALIIHGTVKKSLEVLSKLNQQPVCNGTPTPPQVANATGTSPVLSAAVNLPPLSKDKPVGPAQSTQRRVAYPVMKSSNESYRQRVELFPVWVGNLASTVTETMIRSLFNKVGQVYSVKLLSYKRCAFVNFTQQEDCDEAIQQFHGHALMGTKIAVRYPDRTPSGMGISRSALIARDLHKYEPDQRGSHRT
ncbi:uncharacterized protein ACBR49_019343 isoform 2-T2 [Aulostomus maculatus]